MTKSEEFTINSCGACEQDDKGNITYASCQAETIAAIPLWLIILLICLVCLIIAAALLVGLRRRPREDELADQHINKDVSSISVPKLSHKFHAS